MKSFLILSVILMTFACQKIRALSLVAGEDLWTMVINGVEEENWLLDELVLRVLVVVI